MLIAACSTAVEDAASPPASTSSPEAITAGAASPLVASAEAHPSPAPVAAAQTVAPTPAPTAAPPAQPTPALPPQPFALTLYEEGDWVHQYTFEWCVAASAQMTWNMVHPDVRAARDDQQALWERARELSNNPYRGADPGGWSDLLNELGLGPYELVSAPTYDEALKVAAAAMRATTRPVGLVMWRGRHAWVMSGFESLGDPAAGDFSVTGIRVVDPLYPYGNGTWGPSPEPNQLLTPEQLAVQFVFREQRSWSTHIPAGFLLVLPVAAPVAVDDVTGGPGSVPRDLPFEAP
ncbi:MAG: hypothetical protein LC744_07690 [Chloroflexi bacterium]|nr:hypothetical protein [Chloroflexota bacterium]